MLSNCTFLKIERTQVGQAELKGGSEGIHPTALENKKSRENGRNSLCGGGERGFHCTFNAHLIPGTCSSVKAEDTQIMLSVLQLPAQHLPGHRQAMSGKASTPLERQGGTRDMMGNIQKQQDFETLANF